MRFVRWFSDVGLSDVGLVGGKNASLGEMIRSLTRLGVRVPDAPVALALVHALGRPLATTSAALPPEEPPGLRVMSNGFRVGPNR